MTIVQTGLDVLLANPSAQSLLQGRIGYLCHSASLDKNLIHGAELLQELLGEQLRCFFGPQHGILCDVQDNMVETPHFEHPYFKKQVFSLYGKVRRPNRAMLDSIDTLLVDLQDVGTRVYTYLTTLALSMEACANKKRVVVLDRPNPAGPLIEGAVLSLPFQSFVGHHPIPQRHGLTLGEAALLQQKLSPLCCDLHIVKMENYRHSMTWADTQRPWVNPSPNLATAQSALTFPGTVLFEGTNISEGRGTTRALEVVGAPGIEPFSLREQIAQDFPAYGIEGIVLRPLHFRPTFQKHREVPCGGFHIHVTDPQRARTWRLGQLLLKHFKKALGEKFAWNEQPYEYQFDRPAIDFINGGEHLRQWVEGKEGPARLIALEEKGMEEYLKRREDCLLYP